MKSSSGYEIYHNTLSSCLDEIERYVESKGYTLGDYFPEVNHVSYGTTARTSVEMLKNGNISNSLAVQIYRMDSGKYELNCYPVRKFALGGQAENPKLSDYPKDIQDEYKKLLDYYGKELADAYLERQETPMDFKNERELLIAKIYNHLRIAKSKISKETEGKGSEQYYPISFKNYKTELSKIGKITDTQIRHLFDDTMKTIWNEQEYLVKLFTKNKKFNKGGYTRPAYDMPISGVYKFSSKIGDFTLKVYNFERNDDTTDALEIQDELRPKLGSIIIKNSAWKRLSKGLPIKAKSYKGNYNGTLIRLGSTKDVEFKTGGAILTKEQLKQFNEWIADDNAVKIGDDIWVEQTTQYRKKFTTDELKHFFKREYLSDSYYKNGGSVYENFVVTATGISKQNKEDLINMDVKLDFQGVGYYLYIKTIDKEKVLNYLIENQIDFTLKDDEKYGQGGGLKLLKVGDKYLYKFDGTKYKILGIKDKQVAIVPLVGHKRNWIVSKAVLQKWVQSGMMQKIK